MAADPEQQNNSTYSGPIAGVCLILLFAVGQAIADYYGPDHGRYFLPNDKYRFKPILPRPQSLEEFRSRLGF